VYELNTGVLGSGVTFTLGTPGAPGVYTGIDDIDFFFLLRKKKESRLK
jgi:hypothetical protein